MTFKLFIDEKLSFQKTAQKELRDPDKWSEEIVKDLMEHHPYVGQYGTKIEFRESNPEIGTALGFVEVYTDSDSVKIPAIVHENKLFPMDVFAKDGKVLPLTKARLNEALFSPETLGKSIKEEDVIPPSMVAAYDIQYPPNRQYSTNIKMASILDAVKDTMHSEDLTKIASFIQKDSPLHRLALNNQPVLDSLKIFAESETMEKRAFSAPVKDLEPSVIQIESGENNTYLVKTANAQAFQVKTEVLDRASAITKYGAASVRVADNRGKIVASMGDYAEEDVGLQPINYGGIYKVMSVEGQIMTGMVFMSVFNFDGSRIGKSLFFTDGDKYSIQSAIAGKRVGDIDLAGSKATKGLGVFAWDPEYDRHLVARYGKFHDLVCTVPATVNYTEVKNGQEEIHLTDMAGEAFTIVRSPVKTLIHTNDVTMLPIHAAFLPVSTPVALSDTAGMDKLAEAKNINRSVMIRFLGDRFSFSGGAVEKIASAARSDLPWNDAVFLGCSMGMTPDFAQGRLKSAVKYGKTTVKVAMPLVPFTAYERKVMEKAAGYKAQLDRFTQGLKSFLLKEAVAVGDDETVDAMLSLGFINPENITKFIEFLPKFEGTQEKLCELLMATRMGLKDLDEGALRTSVKALEKVIEGLKRMGHTAVAETL